MKCVLLLYIPERYQIDIPITRYWVMHLIDDRMAPFSCEYLFRISFIYENAVNGHNSFLNSFHANGAAKETQVETKY